MTARGSFSITLSSLPTKEDTTSHTEQKTTASSSKPSSLPASSWEDAGDEAKRPGHRQQDRGIQSGQHAFAHPVVVLTSDSPRSPPRQALASQRDCPMHVNDNQSKTKKDNLSSSKHHYQEESRSHCGRAGLCSRSESKTDRLDRQG